MRFEFHLDAHISFSGLRLKKINMIYDKFTHQTLEAFVRFSSIEDYDSALKRNWQLMGTRLVISNRDGEFSQSFEIIFHIFLFPS